MSYTVKKMFVESLDYSEIIRIFDLELRPKIGYISEKLKYYLAFRSICTIFVAVVTTNQGCIGYQSSMKRKDQRYGMNVALCHRMG